LPRSFEDPKTFDNKPFRLNTKFDAREYEKIPIQLMGKKGKIKLKERI
jgi:hypothetical protein